MSGHHNPYSGVDPSLGYLFQFRYGLLRLLESGAASIIRIESVDDLELEAVGEPHEILQTKHVASAASLADASESLWKTLRIWSEHFAHVEKSLPAPRYVLVTTATATTGSAAWYVRESPDRNWTAAWRKLRDTSLTSRSEANKKAYAAFNSLKPTLQRKMVENIFVADASLDIGGLDAAIRARTGAFVLPERIDDFLAYVEGWWFRRIIREFREVKYAEIPFRELNVKLAEITGKVNRRELMIDFEGVDIPGADPDTDNRLFVRQLKLIQLSKPRIQHCMLDYYKAYEQQSRWLKRGAVLQDDLSTYNHRLSDEWHRKFQRGSDNLPPDADDQQHRKAGRELLDWAEDVEIPFFECREPYVSRGAFHVLADQPEGQLGWHPKYRKELGLPGGEDLTS